MSRKQKPPENTNFVSRMNQLKSKSGLTSREIGLEVGVSEGAVCSWLKGRRRPEQDTLQGLANLFNVSTDFLLGNSEISEKAEDIDDGDIAYLPIIGSVKAGNGGIAFEEHLGNDWIEKSEINNGGNYFWLKIKGDSMANDGILENDLVLVRQQEEIESGNIGVAIVGEEEGTIKRILIKENSIVLQPSNNNYQPRIFIGEEMNQVRIIGKAKLVKRRLNHG